jgi:hypothetical protein
MSKIRGIKKSDASVAANAETKIINLCVHAPLRANLLFAKLYGIRSSAA